MALDTAVLLLLRDEQRTIEELAAHLVSPVPDVLRTCRSLLRSGAVGSARRRGRQQFFLAEQVHLNGFHMQRGKRDRQKRRGEKLRSGSLRLLRLCRTSITLSELRRQSEGSGAALAGNLAELERGGYLERVERGTYKTTEAGKRALVPPERLQALTAPEAPAGEGLTPRRLAYLRRTCRTYGPRAVAQRLRMPLAEVQQIAVDEQLVVRGVGRHILLTLLAQMLAPEPDQASRLYRRLYDRAKSCGVLQTVMVPGTDGPGEYPQVPTRWAEGIFEEQRPPSPQEMGVLEVQARTGLSHAQALKRCAPYHLRTLPGALYATAFVTRTRGEAIIRAQQLAASTRRPFNRDATLSALAVTGEEGLRCQQLADVLSRLPGSVHAHLKPLLASGAVERVRDADAAYRYRVPARTAEAA